MRAGRGRGGRLLQLLKELNARSSHGSSVKQAASSTRRPVVDDPAWSGPSDGLAFVLTIGDVARFAGSKQLTSYLGLVPSEQSSGNKRCLGAITKQGNCFLRKLLVEAAQTTVRKDEGFRKEYQHRCHRRPKGVAKVAAARSWQCDSTGCYAAMSAIRRSLVSRATRGWPWAMLARDLIGCSRIQTGLCRRRRKRLGKHLRCFPLPHRPAAGCPYRRIMIVVSVVSMVRWSDPPEK